MRVKFQLIIGRLFYSCSSEAYVKPPNTYFLSQNTQKQKVDFDAVTIVTLDSEQSDHRDRAPAASRRNVCAILQKLRRRHFSPLPDMLRRLRT